MAVTSMQPRLNSAYMLSNIITINILQSQLDCTSPCRRWHLKYPLPALVEVLRWGYNKCHRGQGLVTLASDFSMFIVVVCFVIYTKFRDICTRSHAIEMIAQLITTKLHSCRIICIINDLDIISVSMDILSATVSWILLYTYQQWAVCMLMQRMPMSCVSI